MQKYDGAGGEDAWGGGVTYKVQPSVFPNYTDIFWDNSDMGSGNPRLL